MLETSDWAFFLDLDRESEAARSVDQMHLPRSVQGYQQWAEEQAKAKPTGDECFLVIESLVDPAPVGSIAVTQADRRSGRYMHGISIHQDFRSRGFAREAIVLLQRYMFGELRYHKCEVAVYAYNDASLRLHESVGFVREGVLRDHEFLAGRYIDLVRLGMTAEEFATRYEFGPL
jgi:RimJ/RimL family protein N-acetyltransferase